MLTSAAVAQDAPTQKIDGFYAGLGGGVSGNAVILSNGSYVSDGTSTYDFNSLSDISGGYIVYAGYQFNKIIAVEASFVDYGSFKDSTKIRNTNIEKTFTSDPLGGAVYANAGYTFGNGLRPFGQLGLGYIDSNPGSNYNGTGISEDFMTMKWGVGLEYAPVKLKGVGFRFAFTGDTNMDSEYESVDNSNDIKTTYLWRYYEMFYVGAQYKF